MCIVFGVEKAFDTDIKQVWSHIFALHSFMATRSVFGGTCAVPGAFGCGKTVISQVSNRQCAHPTHPISLRRPSLST